MSLNLPTTSITSPALATALSSLNNIQNTSLPAFFTNGSSSSIANGNGSTYFNSTKLLPAFKMELYKSENEGFILNLITFNTSTFSEEGKLFILKDVENLGRDIQNILMMEIIKK